MTALIVQMKTLLDFAVADLNVRESNGRNRSPRIDQYNRFVGNALGDPYCAAAVSYWGACAAGTNFFKSGSSQEFKRWALSQNRISYDAQDMMHWAAALFGFTLEDDSDHGHIGVVKGRLTDTSGNVKRFTTVEANTGPSGSILPQGGRNGDGNYTKSRQAFRDGVAHDGLIWWFIDLTGIPGCDYWV